MAENSCDIGRDQRKEEICQLLTRNPLKKERLKPQSKFEIKNSLSTVLGLLQLCANSIVRNFGFNKGANTGVPPGIAKNIS